MARNEISVVVDVKGKIDNFRAAAEQMQGYLNKLELPKMAENKSASIFSQLSREIEKIQNLTAKGKIDPIDDKNIKTAYHNIENLIGQLEDLSNSPAVRGAWSKDLIQGWNKANSAIKDYMASMKELENRQVKLQSARAGAQGRLNTASAKKQNLLETAGIRQTKYEKQITEQSEAQGRVAAQAYQKAYETYLSQHPTSKFHKLGQEAWKNSLSKGQIAEINKMMTDKNVVNEADLAKALKLDETRVKLDGIKQIIDDIINNKRIDIGAAAEHGMTGEAKAYNLDLPNVQKIQQEIDTIDDSLNKITQEAAPKFNELRQQLLQIQGIDWSKILPQGKDLNNASIEEIVQSLAKFAAVQNEAVDNSTELKKSFENVARGAKEVNQPLEKAGEDLETLRERSQNAQQTLSRLQYYFSSVSVFMLFRRAIRSARDAVKELDDAMTETAVVTNYTISDLWRKLPEYTKRANELGVSTLAAYQSATLYYQQGLNDTQVSEMSVETLKMARIAGIEAADATNLMTGAIRAFNMEINKMSAQRVNDVYNKLAAMTAANTEGIATAMTKVASIAHSVGAEFENVAAFLAQMIETTQEAPETLGTALKTVFARFAEVKKLYSEGQITGSDEEGEEINVNKIQEALRTVGISMTDFLVGKEGLDQVIMRLAQKWDSLDTVTQRYIATMAAGSRQQSRFISLLQDFGRTQELINAANNSEGAAQNQFEKTLDSLQSKTEQLRNAWNEFLLDLANSDTIKGVVDLLNNVVTAINKITGALGSGGSGIAKLLLGLGILKGGRTLLGGAKTMFDPAMLDKFGGSRIKAFRYGAASQIGFDETNYSTSNSLGGALLKRKGAQFKGFGASFKNTFIKEEREKTRVENEGIKERLANARKEYKEKEQLNEEAQKRLIKARENYNNAVQDKGEPAAVSEKEELNNAEAEAASANQEYLKAQKEVTEASQPAGEKLMQYGQTMQIVGQAAGIAAGACFMLANSLEQSGNTKAAKTFKILGTTLSVLSAVFMMVGSVAQITGAQIAAGAKTASTAIMNIPIIGWIAAIIAGLIALGAIIANFVESDAERLERLSEEADKAKEAAQEAAQAYDDLLSAHKDYDTRLEEIKKLTKGTEEYREALRSLNSQVLELAQEYPNLKYTYNREKGILEIDEESWKQAEQIANYRKISTDAISKMTQAQLDLATDIQKVNDTWMKHFNGPFTYVEGIFDDGIISKTREAVNKQAKMNKYIPNSEDDLEGYREFLSKVIQGENSHFYYNGIDYGESYIGQQKAYAALVEDALKDFPDDIDIFGKYVDTFKSAILLLGDQTEEEYTVSTFVFDNVIQTLFNEETNDKYDKNEWERKDFNEKTDFEERNNYKSRLDYIVQEAAKQGLISEADKSYYGTQANDWDKLYRLVAAIEGIDYEDAKDKGKEYAETVLGNYYMANAGAAIIGENTEAFKKLPKEVQEALTTAVTDTKNLNLAQLKLIEEWYPKLFEGENPTFPNANTIILDEAILDANNWVGREDIKGSDFYNRASESMWSLFDSYGYGDLYANLFNDITGPDSPFSEEQKRRILEIFNAADPTSIKSLWNTFNLLKSAGIDLQTISPKLYNGFVNLINVLDEAGIAIRKWSKEDATESIKNIRGLANELLEKEERSISKEQYDILEEAFKGTQYQDLLDQYLEQADGSYKFIGEDLSKIIAALYAIANKIPQEYTERAQAKKQASDYVLDFINNQGKIVFGNQQESRWYSQTLSGRQQILVQKKAAYDKAVEEGASQEVLDKTYKEYEQAKKDYEAAKNLYEQNKYQEVEITEDNLNELSNERKADFYNRIAEGAGDLFKQAGLAIKVDENTVEQNWADFLEILFNNEALTKAAKDALQRESLIGQRDVETLYGAAYSENYSSENQQLAKDIIKNDLYESNEIAQELDATWGDSVKKLRETDALIESIAVDVAELNKNISACEESFKDNYNILKKNDRKTKEWRESAVALQKAIKKAFGVDLTADQIIEGGDFFESFFKGEEGSAKNLGNWLVEQIGIPDSLPPDKVSQLNTIIDNAIASVDPEGVNIPFEVDQASLNAIGKDTKAAMDAYAKMFGIELTWQETTPLGPGEEPSWKLVSATAGGGGFGSKKSGGGGGGKTSPWENPYDKYHNLLQEIDELLRTRNDLERQYEKILANRHSTIQDILKNSRENLANLEREIVAQKMLQKGRQEQFRNLAKDDYYFDEKGKRRSFAQQAAEFGINLSDYARYNEETQEMEINWGAFEEVERRSETDAKWAEVGKFLEKYYDKLKELTDSYEDTQDTIEEMEDEIQEILERSKEDYLDFEQELYDALVDHVQQYIDAEQKLSDTIKDAETKVLDHLRESIDLERQIRDNTKTEEDIADKENRLAYLQRDTTGANAVEIMQLQKEIQEARENYQDTLVDQELERLNRISEEAAQQREHQIELMQEQLDWAQKAGYFWDEVESILQTALKSGDTSLIEQLLKGVSDFNEKSMFGDRAWKDELIERFLKASEGRANWELDNAKENHTSWASRIAATGKEGTVGIWWDTEKKQWVDAKGNTYTGVGYDVQTGKWKYENRSDRVKEETERPPSSGGSGTQPQSGQNEKPKQKTYSSTQKYNGYEGTATSKTSQKDADNLAMKNAINKAIEEWTARSVFMRDQLNQLKTNVQMLPKNAVKLTYQRQIDELTEQLDLLKGKLIKARIDLTQYKTGGLTTQTGPAWLDGTPSKPEYVLNAAQTQAFLQLADVLPSMISGGSSLTNAPTAVNIDIDINVDSIANDYDVDRLCDRVKEDLYSDLMYRNINVVNLRR